MIVRCLALYEMQSEAHRDTAETTGPALTNVRED